MGNVAVHIRVKNLDRVVADPLLFTFRVHDLDSHAMTDGHVDIAHIETGDDSLRIQEWGMDNENLVEVAEIAGHKLSFVPAFSIQER